MISVIISMDDCWMINIKAPALLDVQTSEVDTEGFQVNLSFLLDVVSYSLGEAVCIKCVYGSLFALNCISVSRNVGAGSLF